MQYVTSKHGKIFEKAIQSSVLKSGADIIFLRLPDNDAAPADFLLLTENKNILVEAKSTIKRTFSLDAIKDHQLGSLKQFTKKWDRNEGYLFIEFLKTEEHTTFALIVKIKDLYEYVNRTGKRSIPGYVTKDFLPHIRVNKKSGLYDISEFIHKLTEGK